MSFSNRQEYIVALSPGLKGKGVAEQWLKSAVSTQGGSIDEQVGARTFRCSLPESHAEELDGHQFVHKIVKADEWDEDEDEERGNQGEQSSRSESYQ